MATPFPYSLALIKSMDASILSALQYRAEDLLAIASHVRLHASDDVRTDLHEKNLACC